MEGGDRGRGGMEGAREQGYKAIFENMIGVESERDEASEQARGRGEEG